MSTLCFVLSNTALATAGLKNDTITTTCISYQAGLLLLLAVVTTWKSKYNYDGLSLIIGITVAEPNLRLLSISLNVPINSPILPRSVAYTTTYVPPWCCVIISTASNCLLIDGRNDWSLLSWSDVAEIEYAWPEEPSLKFKSYWLFIVTYRERNAVVKPVIWPNWINSSSKYTGSTKSKIPCCFHFLFDSVLIF